MCVCLYYMQTLYHATKGTRVQIVIWGNLRTNPRRIWRKDYIDICSLASVPLDTPNSSHNLECAYLSCFQICFLYWPYYESLLSFSGHMALQKSQKPI